MPVGEDGDFGEDTELKHYVNVEEKTENRAAKSFEIYVESSYAGLGNVTRGMNKYQEEPWENMWTRYKG